MEQRNRDLQLDNVKGLMIFLVLFSHILSRLYGKWLHVPATECLYYLIYSFHMPVFIFVSGYLSKRRTNYEEYVKKAIVSCLLPYLLFNVLYAIPSLGKMLNILYPKWTLWFLLSLFFWKIMVEAALRFRWALPVAIVLSLYAGWISQVGNFLSLSRSICFFPFFLAGYLLPKTGLERVRKIFPIMAFAAAMAGTFVIFYTNVPYKIFFTSL